MSKQHFSNRIKKFALHKFDSKIDQSFAHNRQAQDSNLQATLNEDSEIKLRQNQSKFLTHNKRISSNKIRFSIQNLLKEFPEVLALRNGGQQNFLPPQIIGRSENKIDEKQKEKNLIQLPICEKQVSEKNITLDKKIQKLRNLKLKYKGEQKKRSLFFSTIVEKSPLKMQVVNIIPEKKTQIIQRKGQEKSLSPKGFKIKKVDQQQDNTSQVKKYNSHFIDMEISVGPQIFFQEGERKQNSNKKQNHGYNIMERVKEKKMNQLMNSKNIYHAQFKSPPKIITEEEKKLEWDKKLENFIKRKGNTKVKITLEQLKQFREIVYKRRQQEKEAELQNQLRSLQPTQREINRLSAKLKSGSSKRIKRQQVSIQNQKDYEQLLQGARQQIHTSSVGRKIRNKKRLYVSFDTPYKQNELDDTFNASVKYKSNTYRKQ